ncbi:hypothetical protein CEXT_277851 [Caerostris extrusa]|uniref:Uncharacterized protein n=1 Tax=Caerostris extrusa TaxID=172846 RepID=A0AAV4SLH3_CAEEX|nr:hypothetical protein CEXT_277851 [Caerostris extrusa]
MLKIIVVQLIKANHQHQMHVIKIQVQILIAKEISSAHSNRRKRNKRKTDWRTSLFYDSVDNIFDISFKPGVDKCLSPHFAGSDTDSIRKRAASTSDYSPKSKAFQRPYLLLIA